MMSRPFIVVVASAAAFLMVALLSNGPSGGATGNFDLKAWGDANCSGSVDPVDSLLTLRFDAGLTTNTGGCPNLGQVVDVQGTSPHPWGDVDCSGEVTPVDSLKLLRFDAALGVMQAAGCPLLGFAVAAATTLTAPAATATQTSEPTSTIAPTATPTLEPTTTPETTVGPDVWRGLVVAPEDRCSPYDSDDYPYSQSVEQRIVASMGGIIYSPYTGKWFDSTSETDIEHIVARSEAHDSGLCAADAATKRQFASDLINLTLASPAVNRSQKSGKDATEWLPDLNRCWFASRVVGVRQQYDLTVDERERDVLESILSGCGAFTEMIVKEAPPASAATPTSAPENEEVSSALEMYDDNGNGRITCAEARNHGIAPVLRGHPAYEFMDDRDNDGVVCER